MNNKLLALIPILVTFIGAILEINDTALGTLMFASIIFVCTSLHNQNKQAKSLKSAIITFVLYVASFAATGTYEGISEFFMVLFLFSSLWASFDLYKSPTPIKDPRQPSLFDQT